MTAFISRGAYHDGVQVYQDHDDEKQFYWVPAVVDANGGNITNFRVDYWGISKKHLVSDGNKIWSSFGAIVAGTGNANITGRQERSITKHIEKVFAVQDPALQPLRVRSSTIVPVVAGNTLDISDDGDVQFPSSFQFGTDFQYLVATGNSLFAEVVAGQGSGGSTASSSIGVNIDAKCEFRGEPWRVEIEVNLRSFWKEVRKSISGSVKYGWFKLGKASYNSIVTTLIRNKTIKVNFISGSLDLAKYGDQIFEMGKQIAEAVNQNGGQFSDFFKLEPNPDGAPLAENGLVFGGGWSVSINASYSERSFTQDFTFSSELNYEGNFEASVPVSMPLILACSGGNSQYYNDLDDPRPCITTDKTDALQRRLDVARQKQARELEIIRTALVNGQITPEVYNILKKEIETTVDEDSKRFTPNFLNNVDFVDRFVGYDHYN